jgi:phosphate starvation-inducible PhoH-like protein
VARLTFPVSNELAQELGSDRDRVLKALAERIGGEVFLRGNEVSVEGSDDVVAQARIVLEELGGLVDQGLAIGPQTIDALGGVLDAGAAGSDVLHDVIWRHRGKKIAPKTLNQKRYVDAIRNSTVTFGVGPAGTGKTYLAMALAVSALVDREVARIILTRPAVEAGERLGFLPGDMLAKVDPYLRPLFDALYDMLDADRLTAYMEKGMIEVAPLAFMRGRAQPVSRMVSTPWGFQPIGTLRVGDLVTGSDGQPTPVLGVYPQGRKQVFRVRTQDGAETFACGEHLWHVFTASDRRRATGGRVLETQEMIRNLRQAHQRRYELPVLTAPAEFESQDVPLDPYALGLLLGDGCLTTQTTPSFTTADAELAEALEGALDGIELKRKGRSYLDNDVPTRVAVLQGLLDSDGGPVSQQGRTCRIQYTTCSPDLRDDVVHLVRSLGGVAYRRRRDAQGRTPGFANGRPVEYRHDSFVLDIRLPPSIEPFRLRRKREIYERDGGGRPMRFIDSIDPVGEDDTVCIQVAAADSLYVTDDFLLTHNTLNDSFIILDEAQNTSPEQMQMFLTRLGFGSKVVVTGDVTQIDLPREQRSGLVTVQEILDGVEGIEFVQFGHQDVVRHKLVQRIVEAYKRHTERNA